MKLNPEFSEIHKDQLELDRLRAALAQSEAECNRLREAYDSVRALNIEITHAAAAQCVALRTELAQSEVQKAHLGFCLNSRDDFIGDEGLWQKYVDTLPKRKAGVAGGWSQDNPVTALRAELAAVRGALEGVAASIGDHWAAKAIRTALQVRPKGQGEETK